MKCSQIRSPVSCLLKNCRYVQAMLSIHLLMCSSGQVSVELGAHVTQTQTAARAQNCCRLLLVLLMTMQTGCGDSE